MLERGRSSEVRTHPFNEDAEATEAYRQNLSTRRFDHRAVRTDIGSGTYYVVAGLLLGKPIGILLSGMARLAGGNLPPDFG